MTFAPIAIVGQSCVLPGALDPNSLIEAVLEGRRVPRPRHLPLWLPGRDGGVRPVPAPAPAEQPAEPARPVALRRTG